MNHPERLFPRPPFGFNPPHTFVFNIGGKFGSPTYDPIRQSLFGKKPSAPTPITPVPVASPPVTTTSAEVVQAQQDLRRQALKKRGFGSTIHAGDDGGWKPGATGAGMANGGKNALGL